MSAVLVAGRPPMSRRTVLSALVLAFVTAVVVAVVAAVVLVRPTGPGSAPVGERAADAAALTIYFADLDRLGAEGGQVVVEGMQPGLADIDQQRYPDDVLVRMADGWLASMRSVHVQVRELPVPAALADGAIRIERALAVYVRVAETLRAAALAGTGDERTALIDEAVALGGEADRLYDEAMAVLAEARP